MAIRNHEKSNSQLGRLRDRIRSTLFSSGAETDDEEADAADADDAAASPDAPGNLFQCSTCGTVYIDSEKRTCSECETDVEEVRSELETKIVR